MKESLIVVLMMLVTHIAIATELTQSPQLCANYDGTNLLIAANDGTGTEMCYWFKRCMNNNLFTFFRVGFRSVARTTSDTDGIFSTSKWLNSTASDNIGPVKIAGYADFVGGNHPWRSPDSLGNPGKGKYIASISTASCDSVKVYIDENIIPLGVKTYGEKIKIKVWNTLFDPLVVEYGDNDTVPMPLSSPLIGEFATYTVSDGSIAVDMEHIYKKNVTVIGYYGMQSMFNNEDSVMTPGGKYTSFLTQSAVTKFTKAEYPNFSRFIEHNANGWCQSSWMRPIDLGAHDAIKPNTPIFHRSSNVGKSYHYIIDNYPVTEGDTLRWHGIYTWALPIINDNDLLVYKGIIDDRKALYVDMKQACSRTIQMPNAYTLIATDYSKNENGAVAVINNNDIQISASSPSSIIFIERTAGDVNGDKIIDVEDVNTTINMILKISEVNLIADMDGNGIIDVEDVNAIINIILNL